MPSRTNTSAASGQIPDGTFLDNRKGTKTARPKKFNPDVVDGYIVETAVSEVEDPTFGQFGPDIPIKNAFIK